jgi:hypothetical protein
VGSGSERKKFSFSILLILDEGGLREGWVESAYSSLAATARPHSYAADCRVITNSGTGRTRPPVPPGCRFKMVSASSSGRVF